MIGTLRIITEIKLIMVSTPNFSNKLILDLNEALTENSPTL